MKKVLIVSDTHGDNSYFGFLIKKTGMPDLVIHCGDSEGSEYYYENSLTCPLVMVRGNCDYATELPAMEITEVNGLRILAVHGNRQGVNGGPDGVIDLAVENACQVACYGHTHSPRIFHDDETGVWCVNPGSLSYPRQADRKHTYILLEVEDDGSPHFTLNAMED